MLKRCYFTVLLQQVSSFKKEVVTNMSGGNRRQPSQYQALTITWDGDNLMEALDLPEDYFRTDNMEWPFAGPITLQQGTHAIPFAIRIPAEVNPTVEYTKRGKKRDQKATITHTYVIEVNLHLDLNSHLLM